MKSNCLPRPHYNRALPTNLGSWETVDLIIQEVQIQALPIIKNYRVIFLLENVEIIRDSYGVPHIYGKSDADT